MSRTPPDATPTAPPTTDTATDTSIEALDIGEVVELTGVPPSTLHLWEQRGLVTPVGRRGLRRQYASEVVPRIGMIVAFQRGGFTLAEIADLVAARDGQPRAIMRSKLAELHRRRDELDVAIAGLEHALRCPEPHPMECPRFSDTASSLLPVASAGDRRSG